MRGSDVRSGSLFSYVDLEARVRRDHPLRVIGEIANAALASLNEDLEALYPRRLGRPSIPPERLLRAILLQAFYGIRSERQLMDGVRSSPLVRGPGGRRSGVGPLELHDEPRPATGRRDRGQVSAGSAGPTAGKAAVVERPLLSVDGTLIEAWASIKSFRRKDGQDNDSSGPDRNAERNFHKEKRPNETHQSTTDPEARLYKNGDGQPAKLCYIHGARACHRTEVRALSLHTPPLLKVACNLSGEGGLYGKAPEAQVPRGHIDDPPRLVKMLSALVVVSCIAFLIFGSI